MRINNEEKRALKILREFKEETGVPSLEDALRALMGRAYIAEQIQQFCEFNNQPAKVSLSVDDDTGEAKFSISLTGES